MSDAFKRDIEKGTTPGVTMMVARRGQIGWFEALGRQDPGSPVPMAHNTLFRIFSMTKPIVSVGIMMPFEKGIAGSRPARIFPFAGAQPRLSRGGVVMTSFRNLALIPDLRFSPRPEDLSFETKVMAPLRSHVVICNKRHTRSAGENFRTSLDHRLRALISRHE
jgi:Beta-lactamase